MQIGVLESRIIRSTVCHYEVGVENNSDIYVMLYLEGSKYNTQQHAIIIGFLENKCDFVQSTLPRSQQDRWLWYYNKGSEIKLNNTGVERSETDIEKDVITQLKELDDPITIGVYKSLGPM